MPRKTFTKSAVETSEMTRAERAIRSANSGLNQVCVLPVAEFMKEDNGAALRYFKSVAVMAHHEGFDLDKTGTSHYTKGAQKAIDACVSPELYKRNANGALLQKTDKQLLKEKEDEKAKKTETKTTENMIKKPQTKAEYQELIALLLKEQENAPESLPESK